LFRRRNRRDANDGAEDCDQDAIFAFQATHTALDVNQGAGFHTAFFFAGMHNLSQSARMQYPSLDRIRFFTSQRDQSDLATLSILSARTNWLRMLRYYVELVEKRPPND